MTETRHAMTEAAEARVAAFESTLELLLMGLRIMREDGRPAAEIADRVTAAWQALGMSMTGRVVHQSPGADAMTARPIAATLTDLTPGGWFHVADRVRLGDADHWVWRLSATDTAALLMERDVAGTVTTAHEKLPDGSERLLARRLKVKPSAGNGFAGAPTGSGRVLKPLPHPTPSKSATASVRPSLARVPCSPRAWHPEDDKARVRALLAAAALAWAGRRTVTGLRACPRRL